MVALFGIDLYYQVLISGTTERALDLESASATSHPPITKIVSDYVGAAYAVSAIFALYIALLVTQSLPRYTGMRPVRTGR